MALDVEKIITHKTEETRQKVPALLEKTNKEQPHPKDLKALSELLSDNKKLELNSVLSTFVVQYRRQCRATSEPHEVSA